jgi:hypothetical protein
MSRVEKVVTVTVSLAARSAHELKKRFFNSLAKPVSKLSIPVGFGTGDREQTLLSHCLDDEAPLVAKHLCSCSQLFDVPSSPAPPQHDT